MNQRRFELLCAALLGFGQLCIMTGFDSESFILESVIHSIHEREPAKISIYAGYYGWVESSTDQSLNILNVITLVYMYQQLNTKYFQPSRDLCLLHDSLSILALHNSSEHPENQFDNCFHFLHGIPSGLPVHQLLLLLRFVSIARCWVCL